MNSIQVIKVLSLTSAGLIFTACGTSESLVTNVREKAGSEISGLLSTETSEALKKANNTTPCRALVKSDSVKR